MISVYIVRCKDDFLYAGITNSLERRLAEHNNGLSKLTKNRLPAKLVFKESFRTRQEAAKREREIKGWRREKKENLIKAHTKLDQSSLHRGVSHDE